MAYVAYLVILAVAALNLLLPRQFLIFAFDHASYLPLAFQLLWTALALAAVYGVRRVAEREGARAAPLIAALVMAASFFLLRTEFPGVHGDGDKGACPYRGAPDIALFPGVDGRLQSFVADAFARVWPRDWTLSYHHGVLHQSAHRNSAWMILLALLGALLVAVAAWLAWRSRRSPLEQSGLLCVGLCSPPMLNAYGHFDSYLFPVAMVGAWGLAVWRLWRNPVQPSRYGWVALALAAAAWSHPLLLYLAGYTALLLGLLWAHRWGRPLATPWVVALGVAYGLAPWGIGHGNTEYAALARLGLLGWFAHEKIMSGLQVALPALLLFGLTCRAARGVWRERQPLPQCALLMCVSTGVMFFSLWVGFGLFDELLYSLLGAWMLAAALLLYLAVRPARAAILYAGIVSVFLFVPRVWVYAGPRMLERFETEQVHDRCSANRSCSPYRQLAILMPVDTAAYRDKRLEILRGGIDAPLPEWARYEVENRAFYAMWCLEFGREAEAAEQLAWFLRHRPDVLPSMWDRAASRLYHTFRYTDTAPAQCRTLSRRLLDDALTRDATNAVWRYLRARLEDAERESALKP